MKSNREVAQKILRDVVEMIRTESAGPLDPRNISMVTAALEEKERSTLEEAARFIESGCVQIGCTALEAEGVVQRTRDAFANEFRRKSSQIGKDRGGV